MLEMQNWQSLPWEVDHLTEVEDVIHAFAQF